ncbi:unnamed protein product, partial [Discosporangium mesarthrocarpum]
MGLESTRTQRRIIPNPRGCRTNDSSSSTCSLLLWHSQGRSAMVVVLTVRSIHTACCGYCAGRCQPNLQGGISDYGTSHSQRGEAQEAHDQGGHPRNRGENAKNVRPHDLCAAGDIILETQPAKAPDLNANDLGFFTPTKQLKEGAGVTASKELVEATMEGFNVYPRKTLKRVFQSILLSMKKSGGARVTTATKCLTWARRSLLGQAIFLRMH